MPPDGGVTWSFTTTSFNSGHACLKSFDARVNVKSRALVRHVTLAAGSSNFPLTKINGGTIATVLWPVVLSGRDDWAAIERWYVHGHDRRVSVVYRGGENAWFGA